jgi:hypothetical protein
MHLITTVPKLIQSIRHAVGQHPQWQLHHSARTDWIRAPAPCLTRLGLWLMFSTELPLACWSCVVYLRIFTIIAFLCSAGGAGAQSPAGQPSRSTSSPASAQPPRPAEHGAVDGVRVFTDDEIKDYEAKIPRTRESLTAASISIAERLKYLDELEKAVKQAKATREKSSNLGLLLDQLKLSPTHEKKRTLKIVAARYGDHRHGHVCDAHDYLNQLCKLITANSLLASDANCITAEFTSPRDYCGVNPSPQGFRTLRIKYECGDGHERRLEVPDLSAVRLICDIPAHIELSTGTGKPAAAAEEPAKKK